MNTMAKTLSILTGQVKPVNIGVVAVKHICEDDDNDPVWVNTLLRSRLATAASDKKREEILNFRIPLVLAALTEPKTSKAIGMEAGLSRSQMEFVLNHLFANGTLTRVRDKACEPYIYSLAEA